MTEKINIAEILKECPKGMELYSPLCGKCVFDRLNFGTIICKKQNTQEITFTSKGYYMLPVFDDCECMIFPSKDQRDWSKFVPPYKFKDGDIVTTKNGQWIGITTGGKSGESIPTYCVIKWNGDFEAYPYCKEKWQFDRFATEEEKKKLFQAIKDNEYKWNPETKTLDKLPKFKVGDKIKYKNGKNIDGVEQGVILSITDEVYDVIVTNNMGICVSIAEQDNWELVSNIEPKFKVGDRIKHKDSGIYCTLGEYSEGISAYRTDIGGLSITYKDMEQWELAPNKFDVTTLVPFESKVLMRSSNAMKWTAAFYSHKEGEYFAGCGLYCKQCVPYEGNEHLLNTTNDCDKYFKTWKE